MMLQLVPSQCSINALSVLTTKTGPPTAQTSVLATAATLVKAALRAGVGTTLQLVPLKCSARFWVGPDWVKISPTAQLSFEAIAVAATSREPLINGLGTTTRLFV